MNWETRKDMHSMLRWAIKKTAYQNPDDAFSVYDIIEEIHKVWDELFEEEILVKKE